MPASVSVTLHTDGEAATVAGVVYMQNVISRQEGVNDSTYVGAYSAFLECWDRLVNYQLVNMSRLVSDIDVNFLNEQVFDYLFAGYPVT